MASVSANRTSMGRRKQNSPGRSRGSSGTERRPGVPTGTSAEGPLDDGLWAMTPSVGCSAMRALGVLPPWLRRGLEAGVIAALVGIVTLIGSTGGGAAGRVVLPQGLAGSLLLAPAVL